MRKLVVQTFVSIDGVMQGPGSPDEDRDGGFERGGWVVPFLNDQFMAETREVDIEPDALLLGRRTYEIFAEAWPARSDRVAQQLNSVRKYVASRTLTKAGWSNSTLLSGDVAEAVAELKREPDEGEIQVHGSWGLIQTLLRHDLVDEFRIKVFPVLVGPGKRLFGDGTVPLGLRLVDTKITSNGVTMSTYARVGKLRLGVYGPEHHFLGEATHA